MGGWHLLTVTIPGRHVQDRLSEGHRKPASMSITHGLQGVWKRETPCNDFISPSSVNPTMHLSPAVKSLFVWPDSDFRISTELWRFIIFASQRSDLKPRTSVPLFWHWATVLMDKFTQRIMAAFPTDLWSHRNIPLHGSTGALSANTKPKIRPVFSFHMLSGHTCQTAWLGPLLCSVNERRFKSRRNKT